MKYIIMTLIGLFIFAATVRCEAGPDVIFKTLSERIKKNCPEAQIEITKETLISKYGTMIFTIHSISKTGEVFSRTYQQEGPNFKGFILRISLHEGKYGGAAKVPQTFKEPYFFTFLDAPTTDDGRKHYQVNFSYGSQLDPELKKAILEAIPKKGFQKNE